MSKLDRPWKLTDFEEARAGMRDPADLRALDPNGMPMAFAAALDSATMAGLIMGLVDQAREGGEDSALTRIEALLQEQVTLLRVQNEQIRALVELLSSRAKRASAMEQAEWEAGPPSEPSPPPPQQPRPRTKGVRGS